MDVVYDVVRFVIWLVGAICEIEGKVKEVDDLHVALNDYFESIFFEDFLEIFFDLLCLGSTCIFEIGKTIVSVQSNRFFVISFCDD